MQGAHSRLAPPPLKSSIDCRIAQAMKCNTARISNPIDLSIWFPKPNDATIQIPCRNLSLPLH
ncbi:hypothetical protein C7S17_6717 [Burkholderia thailandensis]|nr:hypothetical protein [Burkholderia thailandensis]